MSQIRPVDFLNPNNSQNYHIQEKAIKNIIVSLLKNYPDAYDNELFMLFNDISPIQLTKADFFYLKNLYYGQSKKSLTSLNARMNYHFDVAMTTNHMDSLDIIVHQKLYYPVSPLPVDVQEFPKFRFVFL